MTMYDVLKGFADVLEKQIDTDFAYEHPELWESFEDTINRMYEMHEITKEEYNSLALTAFYDFDGLKATEQDIDW